MRRTLIALLLCGSATATAQVQWTPLIEDSEPVPLFGTTTPPNGFVPPNLSPTAIEGLSTFYNPDTRTFGTVNQMGNGEYMINENNGQRLTTCQRQMNGSTTCN